MSKLINCSVSEKVYSDINISFKARGILENLRDKPEGYEFIVEDLTMDASDGMTAICSGMKELTEHRYIHRAVERDGTRGIKDHIHLVFPKPTSEKKAKRYLPKNFKLVEGRY